MLEASSLLDILTLLFLGYLGVKIPFPCFSKLRPYICSLACALQMPQGKWPCAGLLPGYTAGVPRALITP